MVVTHISKKNLDFYEKKICEYIIDSNKISERMENIGGLKEIKEDIFYNILLPLQYPHIFFESPKLMPNRGILLYGPPGTGKTLLAKAIAAEARVPFISLSLSSIEDKYYGESPKLIQGVFSLARKIQPCIVFFDEIDGLLRKRSEMDQSSTYGLKTELLSQIDGMASNKTDSIFVMGTTNSISSLDAALKRRLPKVYEIALPTTSERIDILKLKLIDESDIDDHLLEWVGKMTIGFSGSDLHELISQVCTVRFRQQCSKKNFKDMLPEMKSIADLPPFHSLTKSHFLKAFETSQKFREMIKILSNSENDESDEESPPEPLY